MGHAIVWVVTMVSTTAAYASWGFVPALVVFAVLATVLTLLRVSWEDRTVETKTTTRGGFFKEAFLSGFEEGRENMREKQERKRLEREEKKAEKERRKQEEQ